MVHALIGRSRCRSRDATVEAIGGDADARRSCQNREPPMFRGDVVSVKQSGRKAKKGHHGHEQATSITDLSPCLRYCDPRRCPLALHFQKTQAEAKQTPEPDSP